MSSMHITLVANPDMELQVLGNDEDSIMVGVAPEIGGNGKGLRPMQLVLAALASCSSIDFLSILKKQRVEFSKLQIEVEGKRADSVPSPFKEIHLCFILEANPENQAKAEKAAKLSVEKYCSVAEMLKQSVSITHKVVLKG